jgi:hypothetical protein
MEKITSAQERAWKKLFASISVMLYVSLYHEMCLVSLQAGVFNVHQGALSKSCPTNACQVGEKRTSSDINLSYSLSMFILATL